MLHSSRTEKDDASACVAPTAPGFEKLLEKRHKPPPQGAPCGVGLSAFPNAVSTIAASRATVDVSPRCPHLCGSPLQHNYSFNPKPPTSLVIVGRTANIGFGRAALGSG